MRGTLLACGLMLLTGSIFAQRTEGSSQIAPKLLEAIDDQTLFLNPKYVDSAGPVASQRIYLRDLHLSFGELTDQRFSAYPYDKSVADAWIVENYLIVLAKSTGTAQVAVTASNEFGSMIDWFIVQVLEREDDRMTNQSDPTSQPEFSITPIQYKSEVDTQLPDLPGQTAHYHIVPDLPSGLIFDIEKRAIRGRVDGAIPSSPYYWIAISDSAVVVQQFNFVSRYEAEIAKTKANTSLAVLAFDESLSASVIDSPNLVGDQISSSSNSQPSERIAASLPVRPQSVADVSIHRNLLFGVTNAMHSRFRDVTLRQSSADSNGYTLWNYASTRYQSDRSSVGVEPSGIYVGFDTQLEDNLTTGLTIGFDRQGYTMNSLRTSNRSRNFAGTNLSSILPYARWHDGSGAEIWGILGVAKESSQLDAVQSSTSDLRKRNLLLGAVGWRHSLGSTGNVHLATVGDAGLTIPLQTNTFDSDAGLLDQISARSIRAGLEMTYAGEQLQPYIGLSGRINSNPETRDASLEALGGVRYTSLGGLTFEAEGRAFSAQDVFDDPELVFSVAAHLDPGLRGEGLALSVAPIYGINRSRMLLTPDSSLGYTTYDDAPLNASSEYAWAMSGSLSYGLPLRGAGVITPFGQIAISTLNQTRMGVRVALNSNLDRLFNLEIATVQSRFEQQKFDKGVDIQLRLVF
ncbi:MAG: hypothetical protein OXG05_02830 [Gammaproteobacteria bacterium]|nr:hypothetical protein [Gammaproteobacteria bacterium]